jgi:hypothetical protein
MRHVTVEDLKKQTIEVYRVPLDEYDTVVFNLKDFGAVDKMSNRVNFIKKEAETLDDEALFNAAYSRFASNINFQLDYVAFITDQSLSDTPVTLPKSSIAIARR